MDLFVNSSLLPDNNTDWHDMENEGIFRDTNGVTIPLKNPYNGVSQIAFIKVQIPILRINCLWKFDRVFWFTGPGTLPDTLTEYAVGFTGYYFQELTMKEWATAMEDGMNAVSPGVIVVEWEWLPKQGRFRFRSNKEVWLNFEKTPWIAERLGFLPVTYHYREELATLQWFVYAPKKAIEHFWIGNIYISVDEFESENTIMVNDLSNKNIVMGFYIDSIPENQPYFSWEPQSSQVFNFNETFNLNQITVTFYKEIYGKLYPLPVFGDWSLNLTVLTYLQARTEKYLETKV